MRPSRGVLLYGAPGCGKTTLVRAVAGLAGVAFLHASGLLSTLFLFVFLLISLSLEMSVQRSREGGDLPSAAPALPLAYTQRNLYR